MFAGTFSLPSSPRVSTTPEPCTTTNTTSEMIAPSPCLALVQSLLLLRRQHISRTRPPKPPFSDYAPSPSPFPPFAPVQKRQKPRAQRPIHSPSGRGAAPRFRTSNREAHPPLHPSPPPPPFPLRSPVPLLPLLFINPPFGIKSRAEALRDAQGATGAIRLLITTP
jgi:hypothetical protein